MAGATIPNMSSTAVSSAYAEGSADSYTYFQSPVYPDHNKGFIERNGVLLLAVVGLAVWYLKGRK